ncbi:MAG: VOC family protein [Deltaproteobacteria bacterium]|nr:VOC family protein [Deltaproteobacteria bacterium]
MELKGIDRVVIGVRDMEKGLRFFRDLFGFEFVEMRGPLFDAAGVRVCIDLERHLELISPGADVDVNPPDTKTLRAWLEERGEAVLFALALKVGDPAAAAREAEERGIRIVARVQEQGVESLGLASFQEVILDERDTLGVKLAVAGWERAERSRGEGLPAGRYPVREGHFHLAEAPGEESYLIGGRCRKCGTRFFPKRLVCPECVEPETMEETRLSGKGRFHGYTVLHLPLPGFPAPYGFGRLELDEGPTVTAMVIGRTPAEGAVRIGERGEVVIGTLTTDAAGNEVVGWLLRPAGSA